MIRSFTIYHYLSLFLISIWHQRFVLSKQRSETGTRISG